MDKRSKRKIRQERDALTRRFAERGFAEKRSPREEVIEILSEGLWTLMCQGRGPASGHFESLRQSFQSAPDSKSNEAHGDSSSV